MKKMSSQTFLLARLEAKTWGAANVEGYLTLHSETKNLLAVVFPMSIVFGDYFVECMP